MFVLQNILVLLLYCQILCCPVPDISGSFLTVMFIKNKHFTILLTYNKSHLGL